MKRWYRLVCASIPRNVSLALLLAAACAATLAFVSTAFADPAWVRDTVRGDVRILLWSEGEWSLNGNPVPGCKTFVGGTSTGPGHITDADSLICSPMPSDWHWSVTLPGGATLNWGVDNMPVGVEVCADIFYSREHPILIGKADALEDWLIVADGILNDVLYEGPLSTFDAEEEGFTPTQGRRCGIIRPIPPGACCFADGHCEINFEIDCTEAGGTYLGDDTLCDPNPCVQPPMACCFPDGHCEFVTADLCGQLGGVPQGYGTVCDPNSCPQPPQACCFPDGHCEFVTADLCGQLGGIPQGYGTVCDPNSCPQPPQACCFTDCTCQMLTERDCIDHGGSPMGIGVTCDPNPCDCPPPTGACCIGDQGDCQILNEDQCAAADGTYQGNGSTCEPNNPCPIVPTQSTTWGKIKSAYR